MLYFKGIDRSVPFTISFATTMTGKCDTSVKTQNCNVCTLCPSQSFAGRGGIVGMLFQGSSPPLRPSEWASCIGVPAPSFFYIKELLLLILESNSQLWGLIWGMKRICSLPWYCIMPWIMFFPIFFSQDWQGDEGLCPDFRLLIVSITSNSSASSSVLKWFSSCFFPSSLLRNLFVAGFNHGMIQV